MTEDTQRTIQKDRIADFIEKEILDGKLKPNQRLVERDLAERFGVSRSPVRDALGRLAARGLVRIVPQSGTYVAEMPLTVILHHFELMAGLEGLCARYCAQRATHDDIRELTRIVRDCEKIARSGKAEEYSAVNLDFHNAIYRMSGNPVLEEAARWSRERVAYFRRMTLDLPDRLSRSVAEHQEILQAIKDRDGDRADALMRDHSDIRKTEFTQFVSMVVKGREA
ncbi:MAG: GntR family transcriptional regulator [Mesorhizobium sp.]|nr:GntR family transcriptional regulator [Mesorhizobium sp.]MCO5163685.1 GntR family transcriptional regulator [Mesorhizobium sp.]